MGQAIPRQHPAVVLRSHHRQLRALLALALVVLVGLSVALVLVANDDESTTTSSAIPGQSIEYGDFNPQTGRPLANVATPNVAANPPIAYGDFNPQTGRPLANGVAPDESNIAAAISGAQPVADPSSGPDESTVAASIGHRTADPSVSQAQPGPRP
jgi:hypothetical protein